MPKNNVMTIRVPEELKTRIKKSALLQGVSINQFALYAFTKELSALEHAQYFKTFLQGKKRNEIIKGFDEVFGKVKNRAVEDWDRNIE